MLAAGQAFARRLWHAGLMDQGTTAVLSGFIGASAGIGSGLLLEAYRRRRDRKGVASALAGEISAILTITSMRQYEQLFAGLLSRIEAGEDVPIPLVITNDPNALDPIIAKHIDKLGMLGGNLPERVAHFHYVLNALRIDAVALAKVPTGNVAGKRGVMTQDLALWRDAEPKARALAAQLKKIATPQLWGFW
jgi:hypothetical protein